MERCDECGKGRMMRKKVDYGVLGVSLGPFDALVCQQCGQTLFEGETLELIEKAARKKGLWGIAAKTRVGTSGNALDVKIPKALAEFFKLQKGQEVLLEPLDKRRFQVTLT